MGNELMEKKMSFEVSGETVDLTPNMVKEFLTRGNSDVSTKEAIMFMNLCKFQKLNPFLNEAYLVKFGTQPAQKIVSKEAYMKKAESNPNYDGFQAGLIIIRDKKLIEVEGAFKLKTDTLLGGWATVYRTDRKNPITMKVSMDEYSTGKSTWIQKPATMIRKVAIVQAQREAFPNELGALYTDIEQGVEADQVNEAPVDQEIVREANSGESVSFDNPEVEDVEPKEVVDKVGDNVDELTDEEKAEIIKEEAESTKKKKDGPGF